MRILFEELVTKVKRVDLIGQVRKLRSSFIHGIKTMPVALLPN
jgi:hypothetical protein